MNMAIARNTKNLDASERKGIGAVEETPVEASDDKPNPPPEPQEPMKVPRGSEDMPIPNQGFQHGDVPKRVADEG